jgi:hypothetical protein
MNVLSKWILFVLFIFTSHAFAEVALDSDDNAATFSGTWTQSNVGTSFYGNDFAIAQGAGSADSARFYSPRTITSTGTWCIQARWISGANRTAAAKYQVFDGTTLRSTFTANQQVNGGAWRRLGCVTLTAGKTSEVRVSDSGVAAASLVVADGIRWVWDESPVNQDFCIAVNGGFGGGGVTFVGKNFVAPANGTCQPWSGTMRAGSTVVGTSTGAACQSNDGVLLTVSLQTTAPEWFGIGQTATDHIELCRLNSPQRCQAGVGSNRSSHSTGSATQVTCTTTLRNIPSTHD